MHLVSIEDVYIIVIISVIYLCYLLKYAYSDT